MNVVNLPYTGADVATNVTGYSGIGLRTNYPRSSAHEQQLLGISGVSPAVNPIDGSAYYADICLPAGKSNPASTGAGPISTLRAGDLTLTLQTQSTAAYINADDAKVADRVSAENEIALVGNSGNVMNSVEYFGPTIDNAKIQSL